VGAFSLRALVAKARSFRTWLGVCEMLLDVFEMEKIQVDKESAVSKLLVAREKQVKN
jgi:hypothetical protein